MTIPSKFRGIGFMGTPSVLARPMEPGRGHHAWLHGSTGEEEAGVGGAPVLEDPPTRSVAEGLNHAQPGDPARLAKAILELVNAARPPLRLPLGSDAIARIEAKNRSVAQEVASWHQLAVSTDGL
ncbi:hypothetical protein [Vitiosangium sp. GDMCC 1.1324]|uniref:hypothetical protein n=1 Tax=Vitiosangium sp. (strain GDMCC 1.1324) TaxID=2138576 RepID=UPI0018EEA6C9|nr:hypothetical protein [Vitiosangium sp. GDMCC 1.1324]